MITPLLITPLVWMMALVFLHDLIHHGFYQDVMMTKILSFGMANHLTLVQVIFVWVGPFPDTNSSMPVFLGVQSFGSNSGGSSDTSLSDLTPT